VVTKSGEATRQTHDFEIASLDCRRASQKQSPVPTRQLAGGRTAARTLKIALLVNNYAR
jgi:hypothetical protein